jgi:Na+/H+ antiporter NhaC
MQTKSGWLRPGRLTALAIAATLFVGLWSLGPSLAERRTMAWRMLAQEAATAIEERAGPARRPVVAPDADLPTAFTETLERRLQTSEGPGLGAVRAAIHRHEPAADEVAVRVSFSDGTSNQVHRWWIRDAMSLLPTLTAIAVALVFRRTLLPLALGVILGALLLEEFNVVRAGTRIVINYFGTSATTRFNVTLILFIVGLIGMVGIGICSGGMRGMVDGVVRRTRTKRGVRILGPLAGLLLFFDDYSNTVVIGNAMRPVTDRVRIPREKLAYVVDSTAAPVAGLMLFSTWIWYEVSQIQAPLMTLGAIESPDAAYSVFLQALPFRFYCIFTLGFVLLNALLCRDYGPMLTAERRAGDTGQVVRPGGRPLLSQSFAGLREKPGVPCRWWNMAVPLATTLGLILAGLVLFREPGRSLGGQTVTGIVLAGSALTGAVFAGWLAIGQRLLTVTETVRAFFSGLRAAGLAIGILFLAWAIGAVCRDLGTAEFLTAALERDLAPAFLPVLLFLLGAAISFATGSSYSTMGILLPIAVPLVHGLAQSAGLPPMGLTLVAIAAVLDGSIFGDHCSPLSDTTVLSSIASGSDHLDHVRTQLPYAVTTMVIAVMAGYIPVVVGCSPWVALVAGLAACGIVLRLVGRRV